MLDPANLWRCLSARAPQNGPLAVQRYFQRILKKGYHHPSALSSAPLTSVEAI